MATEMSALHPDKLLGAGDPLLLTSVESGEEGLSTRQAGEVLGVDQATVVRDAHASVETEHSIQAAAATDAFASPEPTSKETAAQETRTRRRRASATAKPDEGAPVEAGAVAFAPPEPTPKEMAAQETRVRREVSRRAPALQPARLPDERDRLTLADHVALGNAARPAAAQRDKPPAPGDPLLLSDHVFSRMSMLQAAGPPPRVERDQWADLYGPADDDQEEQDLITLMRGADPRQQRAAHDAWTRWHPAGKD